MNKCAWMALAVVVAGLSLAVGCGGSDSGSSTGKINLAVTDAPVDTAAEFYVTFTHVFFRGVKGAADQGPFDIPEGEQLVNLLDFQGTDHSVLLTDLVLPVGTYKLTLDADLAFDEEVQKSWIGFAADSSECTDPPAGVVWAEDEITCRYPLEIPSEEQSGFKPKGDLTVTAGNTSSFTVEFDLRKNVVNPMDDEIAYKLKPTGLRLVNETEVGWIYGEVDGEFLAAECGEAAALVYLYDREGGEEPFVPDDIHPANTSYVTSAPVTGETVEEITTWSYTIGFVRSGPYAVALLCGQEDNLDVDEGLTFATQADWIMVMVDEPAVQPLPPAAP